MSPTSSCPDVAQLRKLVEGTASSEEQAALAQHIDGCPSCQAALDRLGAGSDSWSRVAEHLAEKAVVDPALVNVMDRLQANPQETTAEPKLDDKSELDFLDPPEKPGQIGKLAQYEVLEVVGSGGMGIVLKAFDTKLHRVVAIKVMNPQMASHATGRARFLREARSEE